ncbi:MAG: kinase/pyrophosphorylase [Actinobacteria bacterium]|nr:kinase/pyrophosphorylase [Actinomycetota bacterium]
MKKAKIYVLSDSLGETAEQVSKAAISQFARDDFKIIRLPKIKNEEQIIKIIEKAKDEKCVILYTLVEPHLKELLEDRASKNLIPKADILGPAINALSEISENPPDLKPGISRQLNRNYFRKIEALEFAVKYDDGKNPRGLKEAEIVLTGVSRTSKTPLSMYLAYKGYKVANVPIVYNIPPPKELYEIPASKIVGLTISPEILLEIREQRLEAIGARKERNGYAKFNDIMKELKYADSIMSTLCCHIINVAHKAIEETANEILKIFM